VSSTCFEHPSVHPQEDFYMQFYGISFMHPCKCIKHIRPCIHVSVSSTSGHRPDCLDGCKKEIPQNCIWKSSWGRTLGCSKHVEDTV